MVILTSLCPCDDAIFDWKLRKLCKLQILWKAERRSGLTVVLRMIEVISANARLFEAGHSGVCPGGVRPMLGYSANSMKGRPPLVVLFAGYKTLRSQETFQRGGLPASDRRTYNRGGGRCIRHLCSTVKRRHPRIIPPLHTASNSPPRTQKPVSKNFKHGWYLIMTITAWGSNLGLVSHDQSWD